MSFGAKTITDITRAKSDERNNPRVEKRITFMDHHPPRFQNLKIQLCHNTLGIDPIVATCFVNMKEISYFDTNEQYDTTNESEKNILPHKRYKLNHKALNLIHGYNLKPLGPLAYPNYVTTSN